MGSLADRVGGYITRVLDIEGCQSKDGPPTANVLIDCTGGSTAEVAITGCTIQHTAQSATRRMGDLCTRVRLKVTEVKPLTAYLKNRNRTCGNRWKSIQY